VIPFPFQIGGFGLISPSDVVTFATWNPADKNGNISLSNGNLTAQKTTNDANAVVRATISKDGATGYGYFEIEVDDPTVSPFALIGLATSGLSLSSFPGSTSDSWAYYQQTGEKYTNNTGTAYGSPWDQIGDIVGILLYNGAIYFSLNGTFYGDPEAETGAAYTGLTGTLFPALSLFRTGAQVTAAFNPADQAYSPPGALPNTGWGT
jgi:hypothetical protein